MDLILAGPARERRLAGLAVDNLGCTDSRAPLLLLHGLSFDRRIWRPILTRLEEIDPFRRILAVDLPGHGNSDDQPSYDLDDVLDAVHRASTAAGLVAPVVVGHSASGVAATVYAARYPSRGGISVDRTLEVADFGAYLAQNADACVARSSRPNGAGCSPPSSTACHRPPPGCCTRARIRGRT